jgi:hypothetical protein
MKPDCNKVRLVRKGEELEYFHHKNDFDLVFPMADLYAGKIS